MTVCKPRHTSLLLLSYATLPLLSRPTRKNCVLRDLTDIFIPPCRVLIHDPPASEGIPGWDGDWGECVRYFADHFISIPADKMNVFLGHRSAEGGEKYEGEEDQHVARSHGGKEGTPSINKEGWKGHYYSAPFLSSPFSR